MDRIWKMFSFVLKVFETVGKKLLTFHTQICYDEHTDHNSWNDYQKVKFLVENHVLLNLELFKTKRRTKTYAQKH